MDSIFKKLDVWKMFISLLLEIQTGRLQVLSGQLATRASSRPVRNYGANIKREEGRRAGEKEEGRGERRMTTHKVSSVLHTREHTCPWTHTHRHTCGHACKQQSSCSICQIWSYNMEV